MPDVVIVVDMQRGFLEEGYPLFCGAEARQIIPNAQRLLNQELERGSVLIFTQDSHAPNDKEFQMFPPHCIKGTKEVEIIPELANYPGQRLEKTRYSAFYDTDLDDRLAALKPDKLIVCGICTDICVLHTVADARNRDYPVEIYTDCVASFDEEAHRFALKHMEKILGAKLVAA
ncbi:MAG: cysteine hydrolase [Anaerolineae bacterium]|nr:cysteine hydrolase [Anaerolineae bacterium]